jgi:hypothetical protein
MMKALCGRPRRTDLNTVAQLEMTITPYWIKPLRLERIEGSEVMADETRVRQQLMLLTSKTMFWARNIPATHVSPESKGRTDD